MEQVLIISELVHFVFSLAIGLILFWRYRNWWLVVVAVIFGFLVDADHSFDYFAYSGAVKHFFQVKSYMLSSGKIYVPFHGWEYLLIFGFIGRWLEKRKRFDGLTLALVLPYFFHLIIDHFSYPHHLCAYFFLFRLFNHFDLKIISG